jgi:hypothetical protein
MSRFALTTTERVRLQQQGALVGPGDHLAVPRHAWTSALGKAKAAFEELQRCEQAYIAAMQKVRGAQLRMPKKADAYAVPAERAI